MNDLLWIFVWEEFCTDWTPGLAVAIATNEKEARNLVCKYHDWEFTDLDWGPVQIFPLDSMAFAVMGCG